MLILYRYFLLISIYIHVYVTAGLQAAFKQFGPLRIEWPGKDGKHPRYPNRGHELPGLFLFHFIYLFIYLPIKQRNKSIESIQVGRTERQQKLLLYLPSIQTTPMSRKQLLNKIPGRQQPGCCQSHSEY